ncbi:MAG: DUF4382 domain-containing protein [Bacteroidota bacterium]
MKTKGLIASVLAGALLLFFAGCQQLDNNQDGPGRLVVKITDAPLPIDMVEAANVTITKVEIRSVVDTAGYPFITLFEGSREFNLLELRNGITAELVDMEVPAGDYNLIRLYVDSASITVKDHGTYEAKVPSGAETGIKLFIEPSLQVAGGLTAEVLLDFNIDESFVMQGNMNSPAGIKGLIFNPVIRAVNNTEAGVVEGVVMDTASTLLENAAVWIELEQDTVTSYTDSLGYYAITGIPSGSYIMGAAMADYDTVTVDDVQIVAGNLSEQDFVLVADTTQ